MTTATGMARTAAPSSINFLSCWQRRLNLWYISCVYKRGIDRVYLAIPYILPKLANYTQPTTYHHVYRYSVGPSHRWSLLGPQLVLVHPSRRLLDRILAAYRQGCLARRPIRQCQPAWNIADEGKGHPVLQGHHVSVQSLFLFSLLMSLARFSSRLTAMHVNGMESLPLFFAAVLAGNFARLPARTMSIFSLSYLASRVLFNWVYFTQRTSTGGNVRSLTYLAGVLSSFWVIVKSANKVYDLL